LEGVGDFEGLFFEDGAGDLGKFEFDKGSILSTMVFHFCHLFGGVWIDFGDLV
jgi:hypothetical protein